MLPMYDGAILHYHGANPISYLFEKEYWLTLRNIYLTDLMNDHNHRVVLVVAIKLMFTSHPLCNFML